MSGLKKCRECNSRSFFMVLAEERRFQNDCFEVMDGSSLTSNILARW